MASRRRCPRSGGCPPCPACAVHFLSRQYHRCDTIAVCAGCPCEAWLPRAAHAAVSGCPSLAGATRAAFLLHTCPPTNGFTNPTQPPRLPCIARSAAGDRLSQLATGMGGDQNIFAMMSAMGIDGNPTTPGACWRPPAAGAAAAGAAAAAPSALRRRHPPPPAQVGRVGPHFNAAAGPVATKIIQSDAAAKIGQTLDKLTGGSELDAMSQVRGGLGGGGHHTVVLEPDQQQLLPTPCIRICHPTVPPPPPPPPPAPLCTVLREPDQRRVWR